MTKGRHHEGSSAEATSESIRTVEVSWNKLIVFVAATAVVLLVIPLVRQMPLGAALRGPAWWENLTLFATLLFVTIGGVALLWARMRLSDLGVRASKLIEGLIVTLAVWCVMQAWPYVASGSAELAHTWNDPGAFATLRWAAVMFALTALWEEVAFRGFLLPQLYLKFAGRHWQRLVLALLVSQIVFAAAHAPAHIMVRGLSGSELMQMLLVQGFAGVLLGLLYLRSRNLWIVIGIHGLANAPTPLFGGAMGWELPLLVLLLGWPWFARKRSARGFAPIVARSAPGS